MNKKAEGWGILIVVLLLFFALTSLKKVEVDGKQISTATEKSCDLIGKEYDKIQKICVEENVQNINKTS